MSSREIRTAFLEFFRERGHEVLPSGPVVPANDPTLMFANAGMVQFKDVFTGKDKRPYVRAASSQKCIRISGKHNDLENVGVTARHHTFFEMLGNFSFGDYFKKDAIAYAWDFMTRVMGLPPERMVVTVFGGEGTLAADEEAAALWREVTGFGEERIIRCGAKDNFWSMGETGPCGPCSEIHYFVGDGPADVSKFGEEPGADGVGWTELWNLVFMQFERHADGRLEPLPAPSIDTGAGLERLTAAKLGVRSNYDTDLLRPIVELAAKISGKSYHASLAPDDVSMRVIADHARTTAFMMAEGIAPDRGGRGYVLRRVMRRAIRHGHRLGIERLFFYEAALLACDLMGDVYPELRERRPLIEETCKQEEERFRQTLQRGLDLLAGNQEWVELDGKKTLPGHVGFLLYDTYGFPDDLQEVILAEQGFGFDRAGFDGEKAKAKERSAGSKINDEEAVGAAVQALAQSLGATEFVGYEREHGQSTVAALLRGGAKVEQLAAGEEGDLVARSTPFYAESGGQVGDRGVIRTKGGGVFVVTDTHKPAGGLVVHHGRVDQGLIATGDEVDLEVNHALRSATRRNHSATHLLHYALRKVLGPQAMQKGSLVRPDRLRFDYSAARPLEAAEIARIEDLVNEKVLANAPIETEVLPQAEARAKGAIGIFEEKYGEVVRMLRMTSDSIELCGGTHAARTGDIGFFKILSDAGIAAGVRRIEAATGANAVRWVRELEQEVARAASLLKTSPNKLAEKAERVLADQRELQRELEKTKKQLVSGGTGDLASSARDVGGVKVLASLVDLDDPKALRELADQLRDKLAPSVVVLGSPAKGGRVLLVATVSKELLGRFHAGNLIKEIAALVGGSGGGRPDFAQAGGSDPGKLGDAMARVYEIIAAPSAPTASA